MHFPYFIQDDGLLIGEQISPYILSDMPAALLLRKISPKILMPAVLTVWGIVCALQGQIFLL